VSDPGEPGPNPVLPAGRWPSAWPDLWRPVRDRAVFALLTVVLTLTGTALFGDLGWSWWLALLPLVLLVGPVLRPGRVRRRFEQAAARNRLRVHAHGAGWRAQPPGRLHVVALLSPDGAAHYLDRHRRLRGKPPTGSVANAQ